MNMMKCKILYKKKYKWDLLSINSKSIFFKCAKKFAENFVEKKFNFKDLNKFEYFLKESSAFNNFIYEDKNYVIASVDKLNSENIFYYIRDDILFISNDINEILKQNLSKLKINEKSILDIKLLGYVLRNNTIVDGINSLQAGQYIIYDKKTGEYKLRNYFEFFSKKINYLSRNHAINKLKNIEDKIFNELIKKNKDKKILLALSGGLDSRYVLTSLLKRDFKNIIVYSYGHKNNFDSYNSEKIAKKLNVEWKMFQTTKDSYKKIYNSKIKNDYWNFADQGVLPSNLYFFESVKRLNEEYDKKKITILNGQAGDFITGDHLPDFKNKEYLLGAKISEIIFKKHFQLNRKISQNKIIIKKYEEQILNDLNVKKDLYYDYQEISKYLELWEWKERQTKRVINMQKVYEFFGFDWELPLWHEEYINFWIDQPYEFKYRRNLFIEYLVSTDKYNVFSFNEPQLSKWLTTNNEITIVGKLIKLIFTKYGSEYFYNFMNLFCKFGFMYSPYKLTYYLKKFNEYKDPLAFLNEDWLEHYKKNLK